MIEGIETKSINFIPRKYHILIKYSYSLCELKIGVYIDNDIINNIFLWLFRPFEDIPPIIIDNY